jgi:hypothetical protein
MQTRNGITYGDSSTFGKGGAKELLQKVEQKEEVLGLAPPFSKVDFDEASSAWKLNKKSIGNGCYKYVCVKVKKNGHQCKNDSLKNCEHCKFHSTFRKG